MTSEVTAEEWLRDIAANGNVMSVRLNGRVPRGLSNVGDLYPETIAEVLAALDAARADRDRLREWLKTCRDALDNFAGIAPIPDRPSLRILKENP